MKTTMTWTAPGKMGDALMQWPVVYWWHRETGEPYEVWLDENTCKPLVNLFACQPGCQAVALRGGIESYHCGGQPWNFGLDASEHEGRRLVHLGLRGFPQRQLSFECLETCTLKLAVKPKDFSDTPCLEIPDPLPAADRLLLHGMAVCPHSGSSPGFWKFLASVRGDLEFEERAWIGSARDRSVGLATYPEWSEFDDQGDLLALARYMQASRLVIACGSAMAALAGALKVPCVRVHDPIGQAPKVIWSNLGPNQLNATEAELRAKWPEFRDALRKEAECPK